MRNITRNEAISEDQIYINQSKIKSLDQLFVCPERHLREFIMKEFDRASDAMIRGQYFEYKIHNTLGKGNTEPPQIPPLKNGKLSTIQKRIDEQVINYWKSLEKYGIKVIKSDFSIEVTEDGFIYHGTADNLVEWQGKPYIKDIKLTADVNSTFGYYAFGHFTIPHPTVKGMFIEEWNKEKIQNYQGVDTLQAHKYMYLMEKKTQKRWGFLYSIFDPKPIMEEKFVEIPYNPDAREDVFQRIQNTKDKLEFFKEVDYQPIPSEKACFKCPIMDCKVRFIPEPGSLSVQETYKKEVILPDEDNSPF